jgi:hypothetical protein
MAQDVTPINGGAMGTLLPSLSPICLDGLATPTVVQTLGDGAEAVVAPGVWKMPGVVTEPMILEYRRWLEALRKCDAPAQDGRIRVWLSKLLFGLSGNYSEEMIRAKISAFAFALDDKPAFCFDDRVLKRAQKHFKSFWPSAGELIEFMEKIEAETRIKEDRAWKIINDGPRAAGAPSTLRPWAEGGAEDNTRWNREQADRERQELAEIIRQRDAADGKWAADAVMPTQLPGESAEAYVARLKVHIFAQIDEGAKARRKDEERRKKAAEIDEAAKTPRPVKRPVNPPPTDEQMKTAYGKTDLKSRDVRESQPAEAEGAP